MSLAVSPQGHPSHTPNRHRRAPLPVLFVLLVALAAGACGGEPATLAGVVRQPLPDVSRVVLPDAANAGNDFAAVAEPGHFLLVYFGYTACPDICPTTLADLRRAVRDLGDDGTLIDVAMVTVDPERDVPERLTAYVQNFFADGHALRTEDPNALQAAADRFGADYEVWTTEDGLVEVTHTAFLYAVDSNGRIVVQWPFGTTADDIQSDLALLIRQGA